MTTSVTDFEKLLRVNEVCNRIQRRLCAQAQAGIYRFDVLDLMFRANRLYFAIYARYSRNHAIGKE